MQLKEPLVNVQIGLCDEHLNSANFNVDVIYFTVVTRQTQ